MLQFKSLTGHSGDEKMATAKHNKIKLREVNRHLVCRLCRGYYVDATTIAECLHSFCRSCIIKYLEKNSFCPICEVQIHKTKPYLSLRLDKALQDVVYKVVPGLYHDEMRRRREFYSEQKDQLAFTTPEQCGLEERIIFSPEDSISLSLEYLDNDYLENETVSSQSSESGDVPESFAFTQHLKLKANDKGARRESQDTQEPSVYPKRYLQCPAIVNVGHLKKFVRMKHELNSKAQVDIIHKRVPLPDHYTLMDIAYIYTWKRSAPLRLFYQIYQTKKQKLILPTSMSEEKNVELHPVKDLNKDKSEKDEKVEISEVVNHVSKVNKNINCAVPTPVEKLSSEIQKPLSGSVTSKNSFMNKLMAESNTKETAEPTANINGETKVESQSRGKDKTLEAFKNKASDKVKLSDKVILENKSKIDKPQSGIAKVEKLSSEVKENSSNNNNKRLLLNPVSGKLESVPFDEYSNAAARKVEEKKDKVSDVRNEKENKKEPASVRKVKANKIEVENMKKEKVNKKEPLEVRKDKMNKKELETEVKGNVSRKESTAINVRKERVVKKDPENNKKEGDSESQTKENKNVKELKCVVNENEQKESLKKEGEEKKEPDKVKKENQKIEETKSIRTQIESSKNSENKSVAKEQKKSPDNLKKEVETKKEEEQEKKSNLDMLKSFRKEKQSTKEAKIELKTSNGSTLTITALPRGEKETPKISTESKEDNVYDFDGSSSLEKNDLFTKQLKNTKSKYLMEHRDKWLAKEAAGEWMTFQQYREMLLKENNATENVCTRAKRKSVPNLFRISPEESKRAVSKDHTGKADESPREKKTSPIIFNIHTDEIKKTDGSRVSLRSPPRPIKIESKNGEYFIKQDNTEVNGKSPEAGKEKKDDKHILYQKLVENYQAKKEETSKKTKQDEPGSKNFGAIDLTKAETNSKERKNGPESLTEKPNKTSVNQEEKTSSKMNLEPLLKVPQYSQNFKNSTEKDWVSVGSNLTQSDLTQAFLHLKHLDALNQFNPNALLEQFARKTGNLDLLYQQKIDFIRKLKRHQQATEEVPEKRQKSSPQESKKHSPNSEGVDKSRLSPEEIVTLKNAEDLKTLSRIQDLLEIQRVVTQNFKMPPALLQFYTRPRPYPPPIASSTSNSKPLSPPQIKSQNFPSPSGSLPLTIPNASFLDSTNYGHILSAAGLHTEMSFHQTFKNYLKRQEGNSATSNLPPLKKSPKSKEESGKSPTDKAHNNSKTMSIKQEGEKMDVPET